MPHELQEDRAHAADTAGRMTQGEPNPMSAVESNAPESATFADGLRRLADLLDEHPDLAEYQSLDLSHFVSDLDEMTAARRRVGGRWEKRTFGDSYFALVRDLGGNVAISLNASRAKVCERVQTGVKTVTMPDPALVADLPSVTVEEPVYEWICPESVLADGQSVAS
jgi:hypothetical protein